jgi:uncharacterized protein (DUF169 family)
MKAKKIIITGFFLIAGGFSMSASAQETIKALIEKCKTMENMEVSVVRNKNRETKKLEKEVVMVKFKNNEALVKEFIAAFNQDKDAADEIIERSKDGSKDIRYSFDNNVFCSFSQNTKGEASVLMKQNNKSNSMKTK